MMERFNYPNMAAAYDEDSRILQLLEAESYGDRRDEEERIEELEAKAREQENTHGQ